MVEKVERQKIKLNGIEYFLDSLDEESQKTLSDIRIVDGEIQRLQTSLSISNVAKNALLGRLTENVEDFEAVPVAENKEHVYTEENENTPRVFEEQVPN